MKRNQKKLTEKKRKPSKRKPRRSKKVQSRDPIAMLRRAEETGNVSETCREMGISRTQFYEYKKRFQALDAGPLVEAQAALPSLLKKHPHTTSSKDMEKVIALALDQPWLGCDRLREALRHVDVELSAPTIQKILTQRHLHRAGDRSFALEELAHANGAELNAKQIAFIEKHNPALKERWRAPQAPGKRLCQYYFRTGLSARINEGHLHEVYAHSVVDSYNLMAWCRLSINPLETATARMLELVVLPFYASHQLKIKEVYTPVAAGFVSGARNPFNENYVSGHYCPFKPFLFSKGIEHRTPNYERQLMNGTMKRFHHTVLEGFLNHYRLQGEMIDLADVRVALDARLDRYNKERLRGYPNYGRTPIKMLHAFLKSRKLNDEPDEERHWEGLYINEYA